MMKLIAVTLVLVGGCDSGGTSSSSSSSSSSSKLGGLADKVKGVGDKVGGALDNLDKGEATDKLASAHASIAGGGQANDECDWAARQAGDPGNAGAAPLTELKKVCTLDGPLAMATAALAKAEAARTTDAKGMLTECTSDNWARSAKKIEAGAFAKDPAWVDAKARWTKACPNP